jgi:hypothetical protein
MTPRNSGEVEGRQRLLSERRHCYIFSGIDGLDDDHELIAWLLLAGLCSSQSVVLH